MKLGKGFLKYNLSNNLFKKYILYLINILQNVRTFNIVFVSFL